MKRQWTVDALADHWTLYPEDLTLLANKAAATRLGRALLLKSFQYEGRFPRNKGGVPPAAIVHVAQQRGVPPDERRARTHAETHPRAEEGRQFAKYLRGEHPDYDYLKQIFRYLREELEVTIPPETRRLPSMPTEEEMRRYYQTVWQTRNFGDMVLIKTLFYTGVRVSELVHIRLDDVDLYRCRIRINHGKGDKDPVVPFPAGFKETLGMHMQGLREKKATYLFESS